MPNKSDYGFAYIFHLPLEAFKTRVKDAKTPTRINIVEEREDIQIVTSLGNSRTLKEHATTMFELWTGEVLKSRDCDSSRYGIEVILASNTALQKVDQRYAFGALHHEVVTMIDWQREQAEAAYHKAYSLGYKLDPVPERHCFRRKIETPNLLSLILRELITYNSTAATTMELLVARDPIETFRDLGMLLKNVERGRGKAPVNL